MGFPWARYYDLAHGNPISDTDTSGWFGGVQPLHLGACADGPHLMSDAANE